MAKFSGIARRPRALAAGSLGLAGVATGLVLALSGTAAAAPTTPSSTPAGTPATTTTVQVGPAGAPGAGTYRIQLADGGAAAGNSGS